MNNQKDTKKTSSIHSLSNSDKNEFSSVNTPTNKSIYEFANKKTQKLVTALYLVADCMDTKDTLREKLRLLGIQLLSDIHMLSISLPKDDNTHINLSLARIDEIISLLQIASDITYISEMNARILKIEFNILTEELKSRRSGEKYFPFSLHQKMFKISAGNTGGVLNLKDTAKRTSKMSFIRNGNPLSSISRKSLTSIDFKKIKTERANKIISIIKDKKVSSNGKGEGATIKDIAGAFSDCSEKTIQREITNLISKGQIKKIGSKRWSRYSIITKK